ncbi:MAG: hypothetical protein P8Y43_09555, partial [Sulfurovaceae bacterium]
MRLTKLSKGTLECDDRGTFVHNLTCRILFMAIQKALLSISMITIFFLIYFYFLEHNFFEVTTIPETWIDELIPFEPIFFYAYVSLWVYLSLSMAIIKNKKDNMKLDLSVSSVVKNGVGRAGFFGVDKSPYLAIIL